MYSAFERYNCSMIENMDRETNYNNMKSYNDVLKPKSDIERSKKLLDINDATYLLMTQYEINGSCKNIESSNDSNGVSGCVGYKCLPGNIYQQTDDFNTYHNYLVTSEDTSETRVSCTKNHQVFNNWTKRKLPSFGEEREDTEYTGTFGQNIPKLSFNECTFDKLSHEC